jgi:type II secretory ATPase GspE/PulE/Tfp pilus assembly ATPase PilB-like protein
MLRQAPERRSWSAKSATWRPRTSPINASLTGHLVFSTLHTNDAPQRGDPSDRHRREAVPGASIRSLRAIMAQRLVRKICQKCKPRTTPDREGAALARTSPRSKPPRPRLRKGEGCANCNTTGYRGRIGIFEIFNDQRGGCRSMIYDKVGSANAAATRPRRNGHAHHARRWHRAR